MQYFFGALAVCALVYYAGAIAALWAFGRREAPASPGGPLPPVSILIPLCGADQDALENYAAFLREDYPAPVQMVFGVRDGRDGSVAVVRELQRRFPGAALDLVVCHKPLGHNPKVSNLHNMLSIARHEHIVITDSDVRIPSGFLREVAAPLADGSAGVVTCLYRAGKARGLLARIEALGVAADFVPGVLVFRALRGMRFCLGAVMATTRSTLSAIGGLSAIADHLADDYMLGKLAAERGMTVRLARCVVETVAPPATLRAMMKHEIRWARGKHACHPSGYRGMGLTHGTVFAALATVCAGFAPWSLWLLGVVSCLRVLMAVTARELVLRDRDGRSDLLLLPLRDVLNIAVWAAGLFGRRVEWRGRTFDLGPDGNLTPRKP